MTSVDDIAPSSWDNSDKPANLGWIMMTPGAGSLKQQIKISPQILSEQQNAASQMPHCSMVCNRLVHEGRSSYVRLHAESNYWNHQTPSK